MTTYGTVNDLHSDRRTDADRADVRALQVVGWQECHHVNLTTALGTTHGVHQVRELANPGKAGVAVTWRKDAVEALIAKGLALGHRAVEGMMGRWLAWAVLRIDGRVHLVISGHRPPLRLKALWPTFDANVDALIDRLRAQYAPDVVVMLLDANQDPPTPLITRTGLRWYGVRIDGALVAGATVTNVRPLPLGDSDHRPVAMTVTPKEPAVSYLRILWAPAVLRAAGLTVVEHAGWKDRGLSTARRFEPSALVWHHDASAVGDSPGVPEYMIRNFASAGAQIWVDRQGRWHFIASGRAAHAGEVLPGMPGNETSIGIETDHTTGEAWPPALLTSLRKGSAALLKHMGRPATAVHFHKTICSPRGRKVDPDGLEISTERAAVSALMAPAKPAAPAPEEDEVSAQEVWNHPVPFTGDPDKVGDKRPVFISVVETHNAVEQIKDDIVALNKKLDAILAAVKEA